MEKTTNVISLAPHSEGSGDDDEGGVLEPPSGSGGCSANSLAELEAWYKDQVLKLQSKQAARRQLDRFENQKLAIAIAARIAFLRGNQALSPEQLALAAGVSTRTAYGVETASGSYGSRVTTIAKLMAALRGDIVIAITHEATNRVGLLRLSRAKDAREFGSDLVSLLLQLSRMTLSEVERTRTLSKGAVYRIARGQSGATGITIKTLAALISAADCKWELAKNEYSGPRNSLRSTDASCDIRYRASGDHSVLPAEVFLRDQALSEW